MKILNYSQFINEIVDYDISNDIDDFGDVINQNYYLYSDVPLTLNDVKKDDGIITKLINRGDEHEYIYQIKTKNPIYKRSSSLWDNMFSDNDTKFDDSKYSGYFQKDWLGHELVAQIKTDDITSFRHIGGFVKYDRDVPNKINVKISEETNSFFYSYISGQIRHKTLTPKIQKELIKFKPKTNIKIYKGIEEVQIYHQSILDKPYKKGQIIDAKIPHCTSWSTNILVARTFIDDYPSSQPFVVTMIAEPKDILVDVRLLPEQYYEINQREIIMLPGTYTYKIIWEGK